MTAWISGIGLTAYGKQPGRSALDWQAAAASRAMADAGLTPQDIDGVYAGYATTLGHLMPADVLSERLAVQPTVAAGYSVGGATGLSMIAAATRLVRSGDACAVLVVAGEDRASGLSSESATQTLAQVGHPELEVATGCSVPGFYALLASNYLYRYGLGHDSLAALAVQMRAHAARHPDAHFRSPISCADVAASRVIADPLHLLDCCPRSDGGAAFVVTREAIGPRSIRVAGVGEGHRHQHISEADFSAFGARTAAERALDQAGLDLDRIDIAGIYDSFTVTLALLLEEIGFSAPGASGSDAADGRFAADGALPLNTHGGLLSYGHCGVAGGMAHLAEVVMQMREEAGPRQVARPPRVGFVHADGGVMSAHVSTVLMQANAG